ncbi:NAD(P)-dependent oxidoreductase [Hymenobacter chitinivorans]|uniref:Putative NADH-flavin reductase n=1 Tax=Hymenobacter chitinivorans DSM 11115 TaxID=1121954 RepID=A0A2M9B9J0_9BACT|nr:SDR family oxidoreductase [Hymenobacter chitinivorans]PJJ54615.1 putative NADH-flavin reductase [Hymenobacter chitinivorans DSM 11115]
MKILVFGASGATGRQLVQQALDQQFSVTAFVRDPAKLTVKHPNLRVVQGDVLRPETVEAAIPGHEAVVLALGVKKNQAGDTTLSDGTQSIIDCMRKYGVPRLICESSLGVGSSKNEVGFLFGKVVAPLFLKHIMADKERQEALIQHSGLDWTIVRPAGLTNGKATGGYKVALSFANAKIKGRVSRADVAQFMLKQLATDAFVGRAVGISY